MPARRPGALAVPIARRNDRTMADPDMIRIAAALIEDGNGRMLLVRKAGTRWFMQAGGKIEAGEQPIDALCRELHEDLGLVVDRGATAHLGHFTAPAANEAGRTVHAELFRMRSTQHPAPRLEIEESSWVDRAAAEALPLAPLTRDHVLPLLTPPVAPARPCQGYWSAPACSGDPCATTDRPIRWRTRCWIAGSRMGASCRSVRR